MAKKATKPKLTGKQKAEKIDAKKEAKREYSQKRYENDKAQQKAVGNYLAELLAWRDMLVDWLSGTEKKIARITKQVDSYMDSVDAEVDPVGLDELAEEILHPKRNLEQVDSIDIKEPIDLN